MRFAVLLLVTLLAVSPGVSALARDSLVFHMLAEHVLLFGVGFVAGSAFAGPARAVFLGPGRSASLAVASITLVALGHLPPAWVLDQSAAPISVMGHVAYMGAGMGLGAALPTLTPLVRTLVLIWGEASMSLVAVAMMTQLGRYPGYSSDQVATAGLAMLVGMHGLWLGVPLAPLVISLVERMFRFDGRVF